MVSFSPEEKTDVGSPYINWSKEITEPKPNMAGEIALKGGAEALSSGVQGIYAAVEKGISNEIYAKVDPVRDEFMSQLHGVDQWLRPNQQAINPLTGTGGGGGAGGSGGATVPPDLRGLPDNIDTLVSARTNGKLTQTDYDARLNALAKETRAQYPGMRDYVDEAFKRATGRDSANQYIRSVIGDIDAFVTAQNAKKDNILRMAETQGMQFPGGNVWVDKLRTNPGDPQTESRFLSWLNGNMQYEGLKKIADAKIAMRNLDKDKAQDFASSSASQQAENFWPHQLDTLFAASGIPEGPALQAALDDYRRGKQTNLTSAQYTQIAGFLKQSEGQLIAKRIADLSRLYEAPGAGGTEAAQKQVAKEVELYWKPIAEAFGTGNLSLLDMNKRMIEGYTEDAGHALFTDDEFKNAVRFGAAVHKYAPELSQNFAAADSTLPKRIYTKFVTDAAKAATPPPEGGKSQKEIVEEARALKISHGEYYKRMIDLFAKIGDKTIPNEYRDALIENAFGDKNFGLLAMFDKDRGGVVTKGVKSPFIPGQQWIFDKFTSQDMIDQVWKRSKEGHPEYWDHFKSWALNDVSHVFDQGFRDKDQFSTVPIHYNAQTQSFFVQPTKLASGRNISNEFYANMINRYNQSLRGIRNIYYKEGEADPTAAIHTLLSSMSPQPGSTIAKMLKAMEASQ